MAVRYTWSTGYASTGLGFIPSAARAWQTYRDAAALVGTTYLKVELIALYCWGTKVVAVTEGAA